LCWRLQIAATTQEVRAGAQLQAQLQPAALAEHQAKEEGEKRKAKRLQLYQKARCVISLLLRLVRVVVSGVRGIYAHYHAACSLQPVRSYESALLVRWTIRLSAWINDKVCS